MIKRPSSIAFLLILAACKPASFRSMTDSQISNPSVSDGDAIVEGRSITEEPITSTEVIGIDNRIVIPEETTVPATPVADVKAACATAVKDGTLKSRVQPILFLAKTDTCEFEKNDNLSRVDEVIRARREEFVDLSLAGMSRLCNIKFDAPKQNMKFDDEIVLTLNQYVIASSQDYSVTSRDKKDVLVYPNGFMVDNDGLVSYKWLAPNGLRDQKYYNSKLSKYCIGLDPKSATFDALCSIPKTDTNGSMQLSVPQDAFLKLAAKAGLVFDKQIQTEPKARLGFITTGDNDDSDCRHLDFQMSVTIQYIP